MFDFKTANKFTAFAGLSPQQRKSGTSVNKKEKLSRYGNRILKTALYMPAVVAYRMGVFKKMTDRLKPLQNPQNNSLVLGVSLFQHKHNKIKQNNHTNPTITAHFQIVYYL